MNTDELREALREALDSRGGPLRQYDVRFDDVYDAILPIVAAALTDERERARAPFLALAEDLDTAFLPLSSAAGQAQEIADRIRRAAQDDDT